MVVTNLQHSSDEYEQIDCSRELQVFKNATEKRITPEAISNLGENMLNRVSGCISPIASVLLSENITESELHADLLINLKRTLEIIDSLDVPQDKGFIEESAIELIERADKLEGLLVRRQLDEKKIKKKNVFEEQLLNTGEKNPEKPFERFQRV